MPAPGSKIGPYEVVESIGAGGMGEVYGARDTKLGQVWCHVPHCCIVVAVIWEIGFGA